MIKVIGWINYDNFHFKSAKGSTEEINAVAENIRINGYKFGGDDHENISNCCPLLSNGKALRLSWRDWGYVMALAYNLKTDAGEYNYILWYMGEYGPEKQVFPDQSINVLDGPKGKTLFYELSDKEYHAINNASFCSLVLPLNYFNQVKVNTFDIIVFKYNNNVVLKTIIDELIFAEYTIKDLLTKDNFLSFTPCDNTNFRDFDETQLKEFIKTKYNILCDRLIPLSFVIIEDNRTPTEIYI